MASGDGGLVPEAGTHGCTSTPSTQGCVGLLFSLSPSDRLQDAFKRKGTRRVEAHTRLSPAPPAGSFTVSKAWYLPALDRRTDRRGTALAADFRYNFEEAELEMQHRPYVQSMTLEKPGVVGATEGPGMKCQTTRHGPTSIWSQNRGRGHVV